MYSLWSDSKDCDACYSACWCVRLCSVYVIMCICTKLEREQEKNLFTHINTHSHTHTDACTYTERRKIFSQTSHTVFIVVIIRVCATAYASVEETLYKRHTYI